MVIYLMSVELSMETKMMGRVADRGCTSTSPGACRVDHEQYQEDYPEHVQTDHLQELIDTYIWYLPSYCM